MKIVHGQKMRRLASKRLSDLEKRALAFAEDPRLLKALGSALASPKQWDSAQSDPAVYLRERGLKVPPGLAVTFRDFPQRAPLRPDFEFFKIRLVRCRTYWLRKIDGVGFEKVEICRGLEIAPFPLPVGPIA